MKYLKLFENFKDDDLKLNVLKLFCSGSQELAELTAQSIGTTLIEILNNVGLTNKWLNGSEGGYDFEFMIKSVKTIYRMDLEFGVEIKKGSEVDLFSGESMDLEEALNDEEIGFEVHFEVVYIIIESIKKVLNDISGVKCNLELESDSINYEFV